MSDIIKPDKNLSLAERVRRAIAQNQPPVDQPPGAAPAACLLLDVSYSMHEPAEPGVSKIDALRRVATEVQADVTYAFSSFVERVDSVPDPNGNTDMAGAFRQVKRDGFTAVVLITDGLPFDNRGPRAAEADALRDVRGLMLHIFYVGPPPKPKFLDRLAAAAKAGSQAHQSSLRRDGSKKLTTTIRGLLEAGKP